MKQPCSQALLSGQTSQVQFVQLSIIEWQGDTQVQTSTDRNRQEQKIEDKYRQVQTRTGKYRQEPTSTDKNRQEQARQNKYRQV